MALQQTSIQIYYQNEKTYDNLPLEINRHILEFLDLETLVDVVRYIDKKHRNLVIDILKKYTLTQQDCNSYWFEFIKNKNTGFLHRYLKPQCKTTMIRSIDTNQNTLSWINYIGYSQLLSNKKNNTNLFAILITKYYTYKNIKRYVMNANTNTNKWFLSSLTQSYFNNIMCAIEHNSLNIIRFILEYKEINFNFNKDDPEEVNFELKLYERYSENAVLYNRLDIFKYFTLKYNYTNEKYNDLLVMCAKNKLIEAALHENKPNVLDYIISKLSNSNPCTCIEHQNNHIYDILDTHLTKVFEELSNLGSHNHNIITYFVSKFGHKISINHYKTLICIQINNNINNNNIDIVKQLIKLYLESRDIFPECPVFTPDELLIHVNLMNVISHIKMSVIYECFTQSIKTNTYDIMVYLKDILFANFIKYNITKEMFVKYLLLDCIKISIETKHNEIETKKLYSTLIKDLQSIYDIDSIINIMNIISLKYDMIEVYKYFHNLFIQKSVLTKKIYIKLLKRNLYLSIQNTNHDASFNKVLEFILIKLYELGEINSCQDDEYIPLFINFIKSKNDKIISVMCNNGFPVSHNNVYLQLAIKTRYIYLIEILITYGANIASNDYSILHFAIKKKTTKLLLFIKQKLISDNKLQLYLEWETNLEYKTKVISL